MNAQVKISALEWNRPFQRDGRLPSRLKHPERQWRFHVVVVGYRDNSAEAESLLDPLRVEIPRLAGAERRRPPEAGEIQPAVVARLPAVLPLDRPGERRNLRQNCGQKLKALFGMKRMTVQTDGSAE